MRRLAIIGAICLTALAGCTASPDDDPPVRSSATKAVPTETEVSLGEVTLTGMVEEGAESGCLLLNGFVLLAGTGHEPIRAGQNLTVTGRVDSDASTTCQEGTPFVVSSVEPA